MHPPRRYGCPSRIRSFLCLRPSMSPRGCVALRYFLPNSFWLKRFFSPRCTQHHARYVRSAKAAENIAAASFCPARSEEHTSELQSLMRISYAVFCLKKQKNNIQHQTKTKE